MIDVRVDAYGADLSRYAREIRERMSAPSRARLALQLAQVASGELARAARDRLDKNPTGRLARSFKPRVLVTGDEVSGAAISDLVYARIHDQGGDIRPRRRKFLAIPLAGVRRGQRPREFPRKLAFIKTGPSAVLAETVGKGKRARLVPRYALVKSARIRATGYQAEAFRAFEHEAPAFVEAALRRAVAAAEGAAR